MKLKYNFLKPFSSKLIHIPAVLIIFSSVYEAAANDEAFITSIELNKSPVLNNNRISYTLDIDFNSAPQHFWVYMDKKEEKLILDFYGTSIYTSSDIEINDGRILKYISTRNGKTDFALNNLRSQIFFQTEPDWHFTAERVSEKTIKIELWKILKGPELRKLKGIHPLVYVFTFSSSILLAFLAVIIINRAR